MSKLLFLVQISLYHNIFFFLIIYKILFVSNKLVNKKKENFINTFY